MQKKKIIIAGGGTAGWMTAAALSKLLGKNLDITLIESDDIGTVGVGEATIPTLHIYHELLGLKESEVMSATNATFKLGISFEDWRDIGSSYLHSFGFLGQDCWAAQFHHFWLKGQQKGFSKELGDYCLEHLAARQRRFAVHANQDRNHAYHLDATLYAKFLRKFSERHGVKRVEGKIEEVTLNEVNGFIDSLRLDSGSIFKADLFIDCTGFTGLLIEKALHTGYDDWSHWLPCDRAIAVQSASDGEMLPYTRSIAHRCGWQWRIPLQTRSGNGIVFCSRYMSDDEAIAKLTGEITGELLTKPRIIPFRAGTRRKHWNKNCVAIGLSSGFIEPLESTSIHLIQRNLIRLMLMFPAQEIQQSDIDEFNHQALEEIEHVRDFIILHYHVTDRNDSPFWRYCKNMAIPDSLSHRLDHFRETGRVYKYAKDLFHETSLVQVMTGQGIKPKAYHPIVDLMGDKELETFLENVQKKIKEDVAQLPFHIDFIKQYCPSITLTNEHSNIGVESPVSSLASSLDLKIDRIGRAQTPIMVADDVCVDGGASLRSFASKLRFEADASSLYPGVRAKLPDAYVTELLSKVIESLYTTYNIPRHFTPSVTQSCFSLLTQPASLLSPMQRIPHFDSANPYFFAILHYLGNGKHGNTGFFRHNPTRLERIYEIDKNNYFETTSRFLNGQAEIDKKYMDDTNDHYTLYYQILYLTDRLAIYPGNTLHSILVNSEADIDWSIDQGRLTANIFLSFN